MTQSDKKLINFSKQRIRHEIVAEVGRFQNDPYRFAIQPEIRRYIESIKTDMIEFVKKLGGNHEDVASMTKKLDDYLYNHSEKIEPKGSKPPVRSKIKVPEAWKSPGFEVNNNISTNKYMT